MIAGVVFLLAGLLFVLVGVGGFVGFMHEGEVFGAWFFMLMFVGSSFTFFIGAAAAFGMRIGSLREAWRALLPGGGAREPNDEE